MYERIRNLREDHDLKQEDIARLLHCTQACYSNYETGKRDIPTEVLRTLADFYHVSIDLSAGADRQERTVPKIAFVPGKRYACRGLFRIGCAGERPLRDIFRCAPAHCTFFRLRNTME